jgi:3-oxoacid CoA-transferase subunit B
MGGAMDLVVGARRIVVVMEHTANGESKLVESCTLPLTGTGVVHRVITDLGVVDIAGGRFQVVELALGVSPAQIQAATAAPLTFAPGVEPTM